MAIETTPETDTGRQSTAHSAKIAFANDLRGLAAFAVLTSHYLGAFWQRRDIVPIYANAALLPSEQYPTPPTIAALDLTPLFDMGAFGVALFFLISGFVIPFSLNKYGWQGFLLGRVLRIYPVYIAGFCITLLAVALCSWFFDRPFPHSAKEMLVHVPGLRDLLGSKSIDGLIWTLEVEVRFYVVCALMAGWFRHGSGKVFLAPLAIMLLCLLGINPAMPYLASHHPYIYKAGSLITLLGMLVLFMFIGVAFSYRHQGRIKNRTFYSLITVLFLGFALVWHTSVHMGSFIKLWSYGAALIVFAAAASQTRRWRSFRLARFMADISYPFYVIHGVLGYSLIRIALANNIPAWPAILGTTAVVILLASLLHNYIEIPTHRLGQRLAARFFLNQHSVAFKSY